MLPQLKVASPCPADWNKMTGDDKVRFCSQCNLNVYNLSAMTEPEALKLIGEREDRLCVRFYQRADGTVLTQDCPVGVRAALRRMTRFATAMLAMIFVAPFAGAQRIPINPPEPIVQIDTQKDQIAIHVINQLGEPVRNAVIELQDRNFGVLATTETDRHGRGRLAKPEDGTYILVVHAPLFMTYSRVLAFSGATSQVTVQSGDIVVLGEISPILVENTLDMLPMPMHGIPDVKRTSPNSVR